MAFSCEIITPEGTLFSSKEVTQLKVPNANKIGTFAILTTHAPMIAQTGSGNLLIQAADLKKEKIIEIEESFLRIENDKVTLLVN